MLFKWNIVQNMLISAFLPKVFAVTSGGRSGGVAGGGMGNVPGGMVVREGGDGY